MAVDFHNPNSSLGVRWVRTWRKIYHPIGFNKGYNFPFFVILVGALMGFVLSRMEYLSFNGPGSIFLKDTFPSEAIRFLGGYKRIGIILHLVGVLFAGFFVCFQFVPVIRHKFLLFHRINGYLVITLYLMSLAGVYMIIPDTAGGYPVTQTGLGILATVTLITLSFAYYNIKRLRIDLHREFMIRTWVYAGTIITLRLIQFAANDYMHDHPGGEWYSVMKCSSIWQQYKLVGVPDARNPTSSLYPQCTTPTSSAFVAVSVHAPGPEGSSAMNSLNFAVGLVLGFIIHVFGTEIYFRMTPGEKERLRKVSREKQIEAGWEKPVKTTSDSESNGPESQK